MKRFARICLILSAMLAIALAGLYFWRIQLANRIVDQQIAKRGIDGLELEVVAWTAKRLIAENLAFKTGKLHLMAERLAIDYDAARLWSERKIEGIEISGLSIELDTQALAATDETGISMEGEEGSAVEENEWNPSDSVAILLPLQRIEIMDSEFILSTEEKIHRWPLVASLQTEENRVAKAQFGLGGDASNESLRLAVSLSEQDGVSIEGSAAVREIGEFASWSQSFGLEIFETPSDLSNELGLVELEFKGMWPDLAAALELDSSRLQAEARLNVFDWSLKYEDLTIDAEGCDIDIGLSEGNRLAINGMIKLSSLETDAAYLGPSGWTLSCDEFPRTPLRIRNETAPLKYDDTFDGRLEAIDLTIAPSFDQDFEYWPMAGRLGAEGSLEGLDLNLPELRFEGSLAELDLTSEIAMIDSGTEIEIGEIKARIGSLLEEEILFHAQGSARLREAVEWEMDVLLESLQLDWNLNGTADELATHLQLQTEGREFLSLRRADESLNARFSLKADLKADRLSDAIDFEEAMLQVSELSGSLEGYQIDQGRAELTGAFRNFDWNRLASLASKDDFASLTSYLAERLSLSLQYQAGALNLPQGFSWQWAGGALSLEKGTELPGSLSISHEGQAGIVSGYGERLEQLFFSKTGSFNGRSGEMLLKGDYLYEGEKVPFSSLQTIALPTIDDWHVKGEFQMDGPRFLFSDIASRRSAEFFGSSFSGDFSLRGTNSISSERVGIELTTDFRNGRIWHPANRVSLEGISASVTFHDLLGFRTEPEQKLSIKQAALGDIACQNINLAFSTDGASKLIISQAELEIFEGKAWLEPVSLSPLAPTGEAVIHFETLSASSIANLVEFFDGNLEGQLNGILPLSLESGLPSFQKGYLELAPNTSAKLKYDAQGLFSKAPEEPAKLGERMLANLSLEPTAMIEEALADLPIEEFRIDLFDPAYPDTPIRIQFSGVAEAGDTQIPINMTTNVNGTVSETLNFLMRLGSL